MLGRKLSALALSLIGLLLAAASHAQVASPDPAALQPSVASAPLRPRATAQQGLLSAALDAGAADAGPVADAGPFSDAGLADAAAEGAAPSVEETPPPLFDPVQRVVAPLPEIEPDPQVSPVIEGRSRREPSESVPRSERPEVVVKTIVGLLAMMVLAYLGGHQRVLQWEARLGISQVITAGFPFVVLGMLARQPDVGILSDEVLVEISPLLRLGLGWLGFVAGFRFDVRAFRGLPPVAGRIVALSTLLPFALVVAACAPLSLLFATEPLGWRDPVLLRDAFILGTAATMTAVTSARAFSNASFARVVARVLRLEEFSGIAGLAFVAAFFRPQSSSWLIPGAAWMLLTIGLGVTTGLLIYVILQQRAQRADFLVLTLGSISFAAGAAGYLLLSSVVVAFIAGVLLANLRGTYHERLRDLTLRIERPIYLVSLLIIGSLWNVTDLRGWLLMPVFAALRLAGKWVGTRLALHGSGIELSEPERRLLALPPLGPLAIAIVINAQLLYPGGSISLIVSGVIGGGILTEVFVQLASRRAQLSRRGQQA